MSSARFFNKSQIRMFEGTNLGLVERNVNAFMLTTTRIYNVKHVVELWENEYYHYFMVSYEP